MNKHEDESVQAVLKSIVRALSKEQQKLAQAHFMDLMTKKIKEASEEESKGVADARSLMLRVFENN